MVIRCKCCVKCFKVLPLRVVIAIMMFFACWVSYMLRNILNVVILAMVVPGGGKNHTTECRKKDDTPADTPNYGPRYEWDQTIQGHLLAAHGYGYFATQLPAGMLADHWGGYLVAIVANILMAVGTALIPLAANVHWGVVFFLRFVVGAGGGCIYPAMHSLISRWAPVQEKNKFIFALLGGTVSQVVMSPVFGELPKVIGWAAVYYAMAASTVLFIAIWALLVRSSPDMHPCIPEDELDMLEDSVAAIPHRWLPFLKVLRSPPALALIFLHFGSMWGLYFFTTEGPKFMNEFLGFDLEKSGGYAALPPLARFLLGFVFSAMGDALIARGKPRKVFLRKSLVIFSHFLPGVLLACMVLVGCNSAGAVAMLTISLGINGAATVTNLANHHDLAPNFAGSMYGLMNCIGSTVSFIIPHIVAAILEYAGGKREWAIIFSIGAVFYIVSGIIFMIIGSADVQPWNEINEPESKMELPTFRRRSSKKSRA